MALVLPNAEDSPTHAGQAVIDKTDVAAIVAGYTGYGWSGVTPISGSGISMNVNTGGSTAVIGGVSHPATGGTVSINPSDPTRDRRDIVVWSVVGGFAVVQGAYCTVANWTPASGALPPVKPNVPAQSVLYAEVYVAAGVTVINTADCTDKTAPVPINTTTPPVDYVTQAVFLR